MTANSRVFKDPFFDRWYFWDEAWASTQGPYDEYVEAHAAMTASLEKSKEYNGPPNCEGA